MKLIKLFRLLFSGFYPLYIDDPVATGGTPVEGGTLPPLVGEDLAFAEGWQDRVGEHADGSTFKNLGDVLKSSNEATATIRGLNEEKATFATQLAEAQGKVVEMPKDAAAFREQLKMPETPEGVVIEDSVLDAGIAYAMEKGHGPEAFADFLAFDLKRAEMEAGTTANAQAGAIDAAKAAITSVVGEGAYETTIGDAKHVSEALGLPLEATDLIGQPQMVVALSKLRAALSEGTLKGAAVGEVQITAGGKLSQASDIVGNPENPLHAAFHDSSSVGYANAQATHARLISESAG